MWSCCLQVLLWVFFRLIFLGQDTRGFVFYSLLRENQSVVIIGSCQNFMVIVREYILSHFEIWSTEDHPPWDVVISVPILNVEILAQLGTP